MSGFNLSLYLSEICTKILVILSRPLRDELNYDILDSQNSINNKRIALHVKQRQMKIGVIMQVVIGNYDKMTDLGIGHETGLDILSVERKLAIELKNRTNTDNASSKKSNLDKLAKFKRQHPDYECIYGCVNDDTEEKTMTGEITTITHDGVELRKYTGMKLLNHIFGENTKTIIDLVRELLDSN